ncbi:hypothetical protein DEO72_LG2g3656 [Vigna unguiculata]|uniref:Uncharacterized protein n=1 Tax=Vigna unguiculata TaxID=3917 RepID=A0A4D6L461_VIGUN|nr:hypothetical protein DEO72_LG2g3656 [Vigna unguiculata]
MALEHVAPGGEGRPARRYLLRQWHRRPLALGGTCPLPSGLEASFAGRYSRVARQ